MANSKYLAFIESAELHSLTRAAEKLNYTQSGVSYLIASLEDELGLPLLLRQKSGASLTPEGEQMMPYIKTVLDALANVEQVAADLRGVASGKLRIGTFSSVAIHRFPELLRDFKDAYPDISCEVFNGTYSFIERELLNFNIDCGFITLPAREEFTTMPLMHDRLMAVINRKNPLSRRTCITAEDLAKQPFIVPAEGTHYDIGKLFSRSNISPQIRFDMGDDYAAIAMVQQEMGVTILPEMMLRSLPMKNIKAVPIRDTEREIGIALNASRYASPTVRAFLRFVVDRFQSKSIPDSAI
jgi:DNA-binding transcriptional LysR family regulator